ncbi:MAG TPA: hypothetical protein VMY78_16765 [Solirubrobacteraceae bacterium]|nr:hypothetical protein [Solirubrobacteraceae bacterium]
MTGAQRLILIVGTVLVLGVGLVVLSSGSDDDDSTAGTTVTTPIVTTDAPATTTGTIAEPAPAPEPAFETVEVRGGKPVGGVKSITVKSGDRARIEVRSADDTADEVHLHGYDIKRDLEAGGRVRFSFVANAEGIFEMELEGSATQIAKIAVEP